MNWYLFLSFRPDLHSAKSFGSNGSYLRRRHAKLVECGYELLLFRLYFPDVVTCVFFIVSIMNKLHIGQKLKKKNNVTYFTELQNIYFLDSAKKLEARWFKYISPKED